MARPEKKSLGESRVVEGIITAEQLKNAQDEEKRSGLRLSKVLIKMGVIAEEPVVIKLVNLIVMISL